MSANPGRYEGKLRPLAGARPAERPEQVPPGHSVPAHRVTGWCAACPTKLLADEVVMWRTVVAGLLAGEDSPQLLDRMREHRRPD